jgi:hypothetical protein
MVADHDYEHHEPVVLDGGDDPIVTDPVAPESCPVAGQYMTEATRVVAAGDALAQIAQQTPLGIDTSLRNSRTAARSNSIRQIGAGISASCAF